MKKIAGYFSVIIMILSVYILAAAGEAETFAQAMTIVGITFAIDAGCAAVVKWSETDND
ncbi:MAG: hypothetical protein U0L45_01035 [Alistipes sp.]|jgi:uncharacterized membrane protein YccF (DUF307 family)|nr:hypothetical protein [Alistipes sp.]